MGRDCVCAIDVVCFIVVEALVHGQVQRGDNFLALNQKKMVALRSIYDFKLNLTTPGQYFSP